MQYIRRRYITKEQLRAAIVRVCNAIFRVRDPDLWGEGTTACASDSKKFGAWDQNLITEWHVRYVGPEIMVYWHAEKHHSANCMNDRRKVSAPTLTVSGEPGVREHADDSAGVGRDELAEPSHGN